MSLPTPEGVAWEALPTYSPRARNAVAAAIRAVRAPEYDAVASRMRGCMGKEYVDILLAEVAPPKRPTWTTCVVRHDPPRPIQPPSRAYCAECYAVKKAWRERVKAREAEKP